MTLEVSDACPNGWVEHDSTCYHISREKETWIGAMRVCELFGGELATIKSDREQQFVVNQIKLSRLSPYFWIGGTDIMVEGEWVWAKSGERITHGYWYPGEPNNKDVGQDCLMISTYESYQWDDIACNSNVYYVCEQPADGGESVLG